MKQEKPGTLKWRGWGEAASSKMGHSGFTVCEEWEGCTTGARHQRCIDEVSCDFVRRPAGGVVEIL